jgi:hypothetical protein
MTTVPLGFELPKVGLSLLNGWGLVDGPQVGGDFLPLFPGDIFQAVTHHVNQAQLDLGIWEDGLDGFWKALKAIDAGDEDVLDSTVPQFGHNLQPELGALVLGGPHSQNFLDSLKGDADGQIHGFIDYPALMPNFDANGIQIDDGINLVQGAILPESDLLLDRLSHL